jgi:hypothetical protein|tara:strand:- start:2157 stop:3113 length:957 start_codon:yes stop_codon:yes gene_type:complete
MPVPYSGQVSYGDVASQTAFTPTSANFSLQAAVGGSHAFSPFNTFNPLSFYQPTATSSNISPAGFYGYTGFYQTGWVPNAPTPSTSNYSNVLTYDSWPTAGSYSGTGTTVTDMGGFGNGTLMNGMGWSSAGGNGGGAWILDGVDDYIDTTNGPTYGTNFSVEVWFRVSTSFSQGALAGQSSFNADDWTYSNMWLLHPNATAANTSISFYVNENPFGSFQIRSVTTGTLSAGNWYQVVGTYGASGMKIYVNGALVATNPSISGTGVTNNPSNTLVIGGDPRYSFRRLTGNISTFNIYNSELSLAQVYQNFEARRTRYNL